MKNLNKFAVFKFFLRENIFKLLIPQGLVFLQLFILYLSNIKYDVFNYALILIVCLLIIFFIADFLFFYKKIKTFIDYTNRIESDGNFLYEDFTLSKNNANINNFSLIENIALLKLQKVIQEKQKIENKNREMLIEQNDYFLLWLHQIKTPIASLYLLLQKQVGNDSFQMQKALINIDNYTQMSLHYLKLQNNTADLNFAKFNLDNTLQNIIRKYRCFFIYKNITLNYEPFNIIIASDSVLFEVMTEQIISNALKYSEILDRKTEINISLEKTSTSIILTIQDNGVGIAESDLPKIFDKGYSGANGKTTEKATGIGLYLAKKIADRINCKIELNSILGEGTTVNIKIPTQNLD